MLAALCAVADALRRLHAARLCHRRVKAENVLWLPSRAAWTLVDFGSAAAPGAPAPRCLSAQCVLTTETRHLHLFGVCS